MMKPLPEYGNSKSQPNTNLSRSLSLSILDQYGNEISIRTNLSNPIEIIIPRDPNLVVSPMVIQNMTSSNSIPHNQLFQLHHVNIIIKYSFEYWTRNDNESI